MNILSRLDFPELIDHYGCQVGAEVGVDYGDNSYLLLKYSEIGRLYSIDQWRGKWSFRKSEAEAKLQRFDYRSKIIQEPSRLASERFEDQSLDFVYIDADHRYPAIKQDIEVWFPKVKIGGIFSGHDYVVAKKCDVIRAVDEFMETRNEEINYTLDYLKSWWLVKQES